MIYKLVSSLGSQFRPPRWHKSPWVYVHSGWIPHWDRKTCTCTHTHTHTHIYQFSEDA